MRGRTLSNAFIILDEAQNTTVEQMKMFLTRMGDGSKVVVTGDVTQIDLPEGKRSGLKHAVSILKNIEGIETVTLTAKDVVRHPPRDGDRARLRARRRAQGSARREEKEMKYSYSPEAKKFGRNECVQSVFIFLANYIIVLLMVLLFIWLNTLGAGRGNLSFLYHGQLQFARIPAREHLHPLFQHLLLLYFRG